jgi:hypothetical protein
MKTAQLKVSNSTKALVILVFQLLVLQIPQQAVDKDHRLASDTQPAN